jgi:hypothetical protein
MIREKRSTLGTALRTIGALATIAAAASQSACSGLHLSMERSQAMDEFSQDKSCPLDRLVVQSFLVPAREVLAPLEPPPAEVAADPARLAVWNRKVADHLDSYQDLSVMDISGCGAHRTSLCFEGTDLTGAVVEMCREVNLESPRARLDDLRVVPAARVSILQRLAAGQAGGARSGS